MAPCSIIQTINKIQTNQINAEILKQYEIQNNIKYIEPRAILTNIISVFPSAKHVPHFATRKTANYIFPKKCAEAVQASFARTGGSSLASESCTIRKSWKKIQLPFITCNSANYERHFHNNGQAHTLILNLPFTGKCQRRFDPSNGPANFLPMQRRRHVNVLRIKVNKSVLLSCHGKICRKYT